MPGRRIVTPLSRPRRQCARMDIVALLIAVAAFALLLALIEGVDRI
jgi:hypothetical protein